MVKKKEIDIAIPETEYQSELIRIRNRIEEAEVRIYRHMNNEANLAYYDIGTYINEKKEWGNKYISRLAEDLKDKKGFSKRNLERMSWFAHKVDEFKIPPQVGAKIPWRTLTEILSNSKSEKEVSWYIEKTYQYGWSRSKVIEKIKNKAYELGIEEPIMSKGLREYDSPIIKKMIKPNYTFASISKKDFNSEKEFKDKLICKIIDFLNELGEGYSLAGREYKIVDNNREYKLDLLFYNFISHTFVVIEVKIGEYKYQDYGQLVFYVNLVDKKLKSEKESNTIGILICKGINHTIVKYTIEDSKVPLAISRFLVKEDLEK